MTRRPGSSGRVRLDLCALGILAFSMIGVGCGADGPPAEAAVVQVTDLGVLETAATIRGRDGGYSGEFAGRSIWLYGDTVLEDAAEDGRTWRHNSWSFTEDRDARDGIQGFEERVDRAGAPAEFFPQTEAERAFNDTHFVDDCQEPCGARWALWPGALVADPARERALVFYTKIYAEPGAFAFRSVGHSIAVWPGFDQAPQRPVLDPGAEHPTLLFDADAPFFGGATLVEGEHIYAYGCGLDGFDKPCRLGRVPLADALDRGAWEFYAGGGRWAADIDEATPVFDGNDILSVAWNPYLQRYLAVHSAPMDTRVMLRTAPAPEGPWSAAVHVFTAREPTEDPGWVYDAQAHTEYARDGGRIQYVTYSRATGFLAAEVRLVEVELSLP